MFTVESFVAFTVGNGGCARFIKEVANPACHACDFGVCLLRLQLGSTKESPRCRGFGQDRDKKVLL
ncbi:hypothetical protein WN944_028275 [Citrus x changshan-huyou]|uniref:Uncharacterized protein n=1 Tax=Citrus x changshan-huyou TaxID=2935761 RepID=A0AAP0LJI4_9ROSI